MVKYNESYMILILSKNSPLNCRIDMDWQLHLNVKSLKVEKTQKSAHAQELYNL